MHQWEEIPKDNRLTDLSNEHENSFFKGHQWDCVGGYMW